MGKREETVNRRRRIARYEKKARKQAKKQAAKLAKERKKQEKAMLRAEKKGKKKPKREAPSSRKKGSPAAFAGGGQKSSAKKKAAADRKAEQKRLSAQQSIPYREMAKDGICRVQDKYYSKSIRFYDINYQLAQNEDKNAIFENWCDFLNYFDSSIHFQLSFINHHSSMKEFRKYYN